MSQTELIPHEVRRGPVMAAAVEAAPPPAPMLTAFALGSIHNLDGLVADNVGLVRFLAACSLELEKRRAGGKTGWNKPEACTIAQLEEHMHERMAAGDVVGAGVAAMMIWNRLNPEAPPTPQGETHGHTRS